MISSETNQQIKEIVKLQKQHKYRQKTSEFIVEGLKLLKEADKKGCLKKIYISSFVIEKKSTTFPMWLLKKYSYEVVSDKIFKKISDTVTTQGILGIASFPKYDIEDILNDKAHIWLLLDDIRDPGNLGTIMRTATGAGISGIIIKKGSADLFNPKTVRSTMGAIFMMPFIYVEDIVDIIERIKNNGFNVYGAAMEGSVIYNKVDYTKGAGIVIGNEANGISEKIFNHLTGCIRIPMQKGLESLNAAVAAAIIMYEAIRQ